MLREDDRFSDYELAQRLKKQLTLDELVELYIDAIHLVSDNIEFAKNLKSKRIKHRYNEETNTSEYFFEGLENKVFYSHIGNRNKANELAIYLKKNMRQLLGKQYRNYRATRQNYERKRRELYAPTFEAHTEKSGLVDASSKISFIEHEYEWFLKNT